MNLSRGISPKVYPYLIMGLAFSMPLPIGFSSVALLCLAVAWLAGGRHYQKFRDTFKEPINILFALLWACHVGSAWLSEDQDLGFAIVERRLPFIAFPLLMFGLRRHLIRNYEKILVAFLAGLAVSLLWCFGSAFWQYFNTGTNSFYYHNLSAAVRMNAIYLSAYAVMGVFITIELTLIRNYIPRNVGIPVIICLAAFSLFLSSKIMFMVLVIGLLMYTGRLFSMRQNVTIAAVTISSVIILFAFTPVLKSRFAYEATSDFSVVHKQKYTYDTHFTGTSLRLTFWRICKDILENKDAWLLGVGIGDFQEDLNERYRASGLYMGNPVLKDTGYLGYNPHNQYVELAFAMGVPVLALFLVILILQFRTALRNYSGLFTRFLILISLFCLTESALSTNKGIVFYMFFSCLFLVVKQKSAPRITMENDK